MAIDTAAERRTMLRLLPAPDGDIGQADRFSLLTFALNYTPVETVTPYLPTFRSMAREDYQALGKWRVESWERSTSLFLRLVDLKTRLVASVPPNLYGYETYPAMDSQKVGQPIPIAYGTIKGAEATLIDGALKKFKVAGHAILKFDGFFADGQPFTPTTTDTTLAEFTWSEYLNNNVTLDVSTVGGSGQITAVTILNPGSGYEVGERITDALVASGATGGTGAIFTVTAIGQSGEVTAVAITSGGSGYATDNILQSTAKTPDKLSITVDFTCTIGNPVDIVEDLLTVWGGELASDLFTPSSGHAREGQGFGTFGARTRYVLGYNSATGREVNRPEISLYLDRQRKITDVIKTVEKFAFGMFYTNMDGLFTFRTWEPVQGESVVMAFEESEIFDVVPEAQTADKLTAVSVSYQKDLTANTSQTLLVEDAEGRYLSGLNANIIEEVEAPLYHLADAEEWASRYLFMRSRPTWEYVAEVNQRAWNLQPGDAVRLTYPKRGIDGLFEVLGASFTPGDGMVRLTLSDWRNYADTVAFVSGSAPSFPATLGGASADTWSSAWTDDQAKWARENVAYAHTDYEFVDLTDSRSFRAGVAK